MMNTNNHHATSNNATTRHLDLLEPLCYQPPHLALPSGNQTHTAIIDAFRALFVQTLFLPPVSQNEANEDDPSIFARAECLRVRGSDEDDDGMDDEPIIITRSQLEAALTFAGSDMVIWQERYGAVVVGTLSPNESDITVDVLGLDEWKHATASDSKTHTAIAQTVQGHPCGKIDALMWDQLSSVFRDALSDTQKSTKAGHHKEAGHQKTPSFVAHAVQAAIMAVKRGEKASISTKPAGGYSDAGMNCNDVPRHTIVPLLMEVVNTYLELNTSFENPSHIKPVLEAAMATKFLSARADYPRGSDGNDHPECNDGAWYKSVLFMIQVVTSKHIVLKDCKLQLDCGTTTLLQIAETAREKINAHANHARDVLVDSPDFNIMAPSDDDESQTLFVPLNARFDSSSSVEPVNAVTDDRPP